MIAPLATPPARRTAHNAQMSPRLSRLYTWLQANGSSLGDFSTDECVQRDMPRLLSLQRELDELRDRAPERYLDDLAVDLANVMRRVPSARVTR